MTFGLGNRCSIRLSYGTDWRNVYFKFRRIGRAGFEPDARGQLMAVADTKDSKSDYLATRKLSKRWLYTCTFVVRFQSKRF